MSKYIDKSLSIANPNPHNLGLTERLAILTGLTGLTIAGLHAGGVSFASTGMTFTIAFTLMGMSLLWYSYQHYANKKAGVKNDGVWFSSLASRGIIGCILGIVLTGFYVLLYWFPEALGMGKAGAANTGIISLFDPLSNVFHGKPASQWFMYGTMYTFAIFFFGIKFIYKYRHNRYQVIRTLSVMFFQLFLAYLIPEILSGLNGGFEGNWFDMDLKNQWPLDYDFAQQWHIDNMLSAGNIGWFFFIWSLLLVFVVSPYLTYKYGKRWYCSWVCGCGGLAETAGDPWRHLSDKSINAWKIERWMIHAVLLFSFVMTIAVVYSYLGKDPSKYSLTQTGFTWIIIGLLLALAAAYAFLQKKNADGNKNKIYLASGSATIVAIILGMNWLFESGNAFFLGGDAFKSSYGFYIGALFSGVVGVGFYPIMGSRVWCRFGCPMAAILGLQQKLFSKFRITTNGGQCISCGNCSTYCEMGIDVRSYAQKGQNIVRASCVGCGICSAVCPRGVLRLENGSEDIFSKTDEYKVIHISNEEVKIDLLR